MRRLSDEIKGFDAQVGKVEAELNQLLLMIPNMLDASVPLGKSDDDNVEVKRWGEPPSWDFAPRPHWEIGEALDILDFRRAARMSGARFTLLKGQGALLERGLINFMLDLHTREQTYVEIFPPLLVTEDAMTGTGQLPKFDQDLFRCREGLPDSHRRSAGDQHPQGGSASLR
jgi:seryl-tRNA synthetase